MHQTTLVCAGATYSVGTQSTVGLATIHMQGLLGTLHRICRVHHPGSTLYTPGPATIQKL
jgi:hypothetical protein